MVNPILDPTHELAERLKSMQAVSAGLSTQPVLLNASTGQIGGGTPGLATDATGLHSYNAAGVLVNFLETSDGTMICYDNTGTAQARMGALLSNPGNYGLEIWTGSAWQQVINATSVSWGSITGIPSTFTPTVPIAGSNISGAVSNANQATNSINADGSAYAYNNNVPGTSFFAVWVGNDGSNHMGKNVSSIRYKTNVRKHTIDPAEVLKLVPVLFDRLPVLVPLPDGHEGPEQLVTGPANEFGMIAEQVHEHVPEIVQWFEGNIDGLRFDLLPVAQQSVLIDHEGRIAALESQVAVLTAQVQSLIAQIQAPLPQWSPPASSTATYTPPSWAPTIPAYAAPNPEPQPLPYTIQP